MADILRLKKNAGNAMDIAHIMRNVKISNFT